jgi:hypothetical protein
MDYHSFSTSLVALSLALLSLLLFSGCGALKPEVISVRLENHKKRCFVEDLPKGTVLLIEFDSTLHNSVTHQRVDSVTHQVMVTVEEPSGHVLMRQNAKPTSRIFLTAAQDGEHVICFQPLLGQYIPNIYINLFAEIFLGEARDSRITSPMEAQLHEFAYALGKSNDLVNEVVREQGLQATREREFRFLSDRLCSLVVFIALAQIVLIVGMAGFQWWHMRHFFRSKKLV